MTISYYIYPPGYAGSSLKMGDTFQELTEDEYKEYLKSQNPDSQITKSESGSEPKGPDIILYVIDPFGLNVEDKFCFKKEPSEIEAVDEFIISAARVPIIFMTYIDLTLLFHDPTRYGLDSRIGILDHSIWFHTMKLPAKPEDVETKIRSIIVQENHKTMVAYEWRKHFVKSIPLSRLDPTDTHAAKLDIIQYNPKFETVKKIVEKKQRLANLKGLKILLVDDHASKALTPLRTLTSAGELQSKFHYINESLDDLIGHDNYSITCAVSIDAAKKLIVDAAGKKEFHVILLDFLLGSKEFGSALVEDLSLNQNSAFFVFFISSFPQYIYSKLQDGSIKPFYANMFVHPGESPIANPELFRLKLADFIEARFDRNVTKLYQTEKALIECFNGKQCGACFSAKPNADSMNAEEFDRRYYRNIRRYLRAYREIEDEKQLEFLWTDRAARDYYQNLYKYLINLEKIVSAVLKYSKTDWQKVLGLIHHYWDIKDSQLRDKLMAPSANCYPAKCPYIDSWIKDGRKVTNG